MAFLKWLKKKPEPLFWPCILNPKTGKISTKVSRNPMTREEAEWFLRRLYPVEWLKTEAIPQPVEHPYFKEAA